MEIKAAAPVKFTYQPIVITSTMNVLKDDPVGLYYRLDVANMVAP